ncbi:MAG TPA: GWxTD domain-containing protein [Bacteroidia bacterium]|nr:GWxTD domain-containing protein [Bacteroidia bacterium]
MNFLKILYSLFIAVVLVACASQKVNQSSNDRLYKKGNNELNSKYTVYHINDSVSQLFYELSNDVLIYKKTDTSNYFYCDVKLQLQVKLEDKLDQIINTESIKIIDRQTDAITKYLNGSIYFKLKKDHNYYIDINVIDNHKKTIYHHNLYSNKESVNSRQNFLVYNSRQEVLFNSYYKPDDVVYIQSFRNKEKLYEVDFFKANFRLALPPFSVEPMQHFSYKPDSTFSVYEKNGLIELALPQKGFFHLKTNNATKEGVTFYVYESSYPKIKNTEQMIMATRYIMAKKEFDNCMISEDKKAAIDKFWVDIGGSNERAKELIKKYYGRVQESNKLFSSFQEGWKTDRGMIYIVFGAPNNVSKRKNGEIWTYGEVGNPSSLVFIFTKVINPFTDNDYYLERSEVFKAPWYEAVDMWRQGRIYLDN